MPSGYTVRTSITADRFYITGGTLSRDASSYVERAGDTLLLEALQAGRFCYVLTSRQMGKSSLMVRAVTQLRQEDIVCVVIDLTSIGQNLDAEHWRNLADANAEATKRALAEAERQQQLAEDSAAKLKVALADAEEQKRLADSPNGKSLVTGSKDGTAKVWGAPTDQ